MKKIRALLAAAVTIYGLLSGSMEVCAADVAEMKIETTSAFVRKEEEVRLTFSLEGYSGIEDGMNAVKGMLEYDSEVFEEPSIEDFETQNAWERLFYNPENGQFVLIHRPGSLKEGEVFSLRLRAREKVSAKETTVAVREISVSEGKEDLTPADGEMRLSVVAETEGAAGETPSTEGGGSDSQTLMEPEDRGGVETGDPFARILTAGLFLAGSGLILLSVIVWRKKQKFPGNARLLAGLVLFAGVFFLTAGGAFAFAGKGDLNDDGEIAYTDVELLERHLIGLKLLPENRRSAADMNRDGDLTVTDLALLIRKIEKTVNYDVQFSSAMEKFHFEKGEQVELKFLADISHGGQIEKITVNGESTDVEKDGESSIYTAFVETGENAGVQKLHIADIHLQGGQKIETDHTEHIEILKDVPEIRGFLSEEVKETAQMKVTFALEDPDDALTGAKMEVVKEADGTELDSWEVKPGENEFLLDLEEGVPYKAYITAAYDRTSGSLPSDGNYSGSFAMEKELQMNLDYGFTFGGLKTVDETGTQTDRFHKNQPVTLMFESGNHTGFAPERITVNGKEYPVSLTAQGYAVVVDGFQKTGKTEIRAEQIILENGKAFSLGEDQKITVTILKEMPTVQGLSAVEDAGAGLFRISFLLTDPDRALSNHQLQILNAEGKAVGEKSFQEEDLEEGQFKDKIELSDTGLTSDYIVQIVADMDVSADGTEMEAGKVLAGETIKASPRVLAAETGAGVSYLEKGEEVKLSYMLEHNVEADLSSIVVDHVEIQPVRHPDGRWEVSVSAPDKAGVHEFKLSQVVFKDGSMVEAACPIRAEVLKDVPQAENLSWSKTPEDELDVRVELSDPDGALGVAKVQIAEEGGRTLLEEAIGVGKNEVSVLLTAKESYVVTVTADYDRDTNALDDQSNEFRKEVLAQETVLASKEALELKDVTAERLYYAGRNSAEEVEILDITGGLPDDQEQYYAVIEMEGMPDFYAGIREFRKDRESGRVYAVLDQEEMVQYGADGTRSTEYRFPVAYKDEQGEHPVIDSAEELFRQMAADPRGSFELEGDLDASGISADAAAVAGTFSGELHGNGHKIRNLPASLFQTLSGAYIHDLVIEDARITAQQSGILASVIQNQSRIENVFLVDSSISNGMDGMGAFAGRLVNSSIRKSASVNVSVKGLVAVGGIVGKTENGALIEDCYVTGKVQGTYDHPSLGARTGGITGWHGGGMIRRCYTKAQIIAPTKKGNGGIIGGPDKGSPEIEYSLSMSTGAGYRIAGFDVLGKVEEVYEYAGSDSSTNVTEDNASRVKETDAIYEQEFYQETLGFQEKVWDLEGVSYGKLPSLKQAPVRDNGFDIPNYTLIMEHDGYRMEREKAYANMAELLPMADTRIWVEYGNQLPDEDIFTLERIQFVLPLDEGGSLVTGVKKDAPEEIRKIRIIFENGERKEYTVTSRKLTGNVAASYQIDGTELRYQFDRYVSHMDPVFLAETAAMISAYDYMSEISGLTPEEESRLYADYYHENIRTDIEKVLCKIYSSEDRYPTYSSHPAVQALAGERMREEETLKKRLYAYNYYDKWYGIDYQGVLLSDLMFFRGEVFDREMTVQYLTDQLLSVAKGQRDTNQLVTFYNNVLKNHTGEGLTDFLGGLAKSLAGYEDPNEWFRENFDGVLVEKEALGDTQGEIRYRIWDNLCGLEEGRKSLVLQILTAPQEDMYLISVPSQLLVGSMNRYQEYLTKDGQERERIRQTAEAYAEKMGIFYGISSRWMSSAAEQLNSFVNIQYDSRLGFPQSEAADEGIQEKEKTRDPVMKWVYEANHMLNALNGSAAVADGSIVIWMHTPALGTSDYIFFTFSHETAHNQDGRYFYGGAGRRKGTGGEAHADGNIAQEMRDGCMVFNISKINEIGTEMTGNFSYERIDSAEKVKSFYQEMFETGYVLDYLAAQAFFELTPQQQAKVAVQAEHTPGGKDSMSTAYRKLSAEEIKAMNLNRMEDLWEHKISIRNASSYPENVGTATDGSYGFESFYTMNWYQSHNDSGSPDTHSFKRLGQEMLGLAGYEDGYMVYLSALSENDLDALRKITKDPDITWKDYKMNRYREVEQKLDQIPYFDKDVVIGQFRAAFEADAVNGNTNQSVEVKRMLYGLIKRVTGDFSQGGIYQSPSVIPVTSAEELIRLAAQNPYGYYRLEQDLDFSSVAAAGGSYIPGRFIGILDGNGYQMTGMQYPLFGDLQYAQVKDLTVSAPSYAGDAQALFAVKTRKVTFGNISVEDADMPLPLVRTKTEGYYEYGEMNLTIGDRKITSVEELLAIGDTPEALKKKYVLESDLDFGGRDVGSFAVNGTFSGTLNGNGHSISGLEGVLFEKLDGASVSALTIEGSKLTEDVQQGALANELKNSSVENISVRNLVIHNGAGQVGGLVGIASNSEIRRISVENLSVRSGNTIGGIAGQFDGRILEDCIVTGTLEGTLRHPMGARIGGITGWQGGGIIRRCLTKVEITAPENTGNGGIIGGPQSGNAVVESSLSLSTGVNANRISGWDVLGITSSAYELDSSDSTSNRNEANTDRIFQVSFEETKEKSFYIETLGWSEETWDFETLTEEGLPRLRP